MLGERLCSRRGEVLPCFYLRYLSQADQEQSPYPRSAQYQAVRKYDDAGESNNGLQPAGNDGKRWEINGPYRW